MRVVGTTGRRRAARRSDRSTTLADLGGPRCPPGLPSGRSAQLRSRAASSADPRGRRVHRRTARRRPAARAPRCRGRRRRSWSRSGGRAGKAPRRTTPCRRDRRPCRRSQQTEVPRLPQRRGVEPNRDTRSRQLTAKGLRPRRRSRMDMHPFWTRLSSKPGRGRAEVRRWSTLGRAPGVCPELSVTVAG